MNTSNDWFRHLSDDERIFIKNFVLSSGSLKQMSALYEISYPTLRSRLDKLIEKIHTYDNASHDAFVMLIRGLVDEQKIDIETANIIIDDYHERHSHDE